jgi:hypothetical protein
VKTLTGGWTQAPNGLLSLKLNHYALIGATPVPLIAVNAPIRYQLRLDQFGQVNNQRIWGNDELMPEGSKYKVEVFDFANSRIFGPQFLQLCGPEPLDITQLIFGEEAVAFNTLAVVSSNMFGQPAPGQEIIQYTAFSIQRFPFNFASPNSYGTVEINPVAARECPIFVNGQPMGEAYVHPDGSWSFSGPGFTLMPGDRLTCKAPDPMDPNLSDIALSLVGVRIT